MDKKLTFSGGEPTINFDDLDRNNEANREALFGIMEAFGVGTNENFIISGCVATLDTGVDVDVTAGYIYLNGEILEVEAQTVLDGGTSDLYKYVKAITYDANGTKTFNDTISRQTWQKNRGIVTAATTPIITTELDVVDGDRIEEKISRLMTDGEVLFTDISDIGDWNMDSTATTTINLTGVSFSLSNIRNIAVIIRADSGSVLAPCLLNSISLTSDYPNGGIVKIENGIATLKRRTGGDFDNTTFNATSYNRGWLIIDYTK